MAHALFETRKEYKQRLKRQRAKRFSPQLAHLAHELLDIGALEAIGLLCDNFHLDCAPVQFDSGEPIEIWRLRELVSGVSIRAEYLSPLTFWGGPPGPLKKYRGSILTVLYDAILREWTRTGAYADLVGSEHGC
jgi:hypothetical protein